MKNSLCFFYLLFVLSISAKSFDIVNLTNNEGLSNSSINSIYQDSTGLIWIGTWDGLNVYNGREFKIYKPDPANTKSISNNIIRDVIEERKGIQWIATDKGINRLDKKQNTFDRYFVDTGNQIISNENSFFIAKNSSNLIFTAIYNHGLYYFDNQTRQFQKIKQVQSFKIKKIFFDLDDNLWIYSETKILYKIVFRKGNSASPKVETVIQFEHLKDIEAVFYQNNNIIWMQNGSEKFFSYRISEGILTDYSNAFQRTGTIKAIAFMDGYQLWGTANGLFQFNLKTKKIESILSNVSVLSVFAGAQQIIWVGTDMQGIWQLSPSREKFNSYSADNIPTFGKSAVRTFFEDSTRRLWVGTKGNGLFSFTHKAELLDSNSVRHLTTSDGLLSNSVFTMVQGQSSEYWIGTDGRGINYFDTKTEKLYALFVNDSLQHQVNLSSIYSILPSDGNTLWVGTSGYGMYKLEIDRSTKPYSVKKHKQYIFKNELSTSLSNNIVYSIIRDDATHLWIATRGGGLNRFNTRTNEFEAFRFSSNNTECISSDDILCLYKDKQGTLWAGTSMGLNKLIRFENGNPIFERFTEKEGMPNNTIHGILEDKEHNLWLSTNKGIAKLVKGRSTYRIISYFKKDGLQNNEFSDGAVYESPYSHQFYFGGISGFNAFNPLEISHSSYMPSLLLDAFYVDNIESNISDYLQSEQETESLQLSYKNKSFSFRFIPLDYLSGSKSEISYLLEGYQKDWIQLGTSNTIVFSNLPQGDYVLKVRCSNADKIWSEKYFSLPITMSPPWWASTIAYISYFVLSILFFIFIWYFIKNQIQARNNIQFKELEKQKIEEIHQAKLRFFTNIAHEFSNSLTLIYGPCEQLLRTNSTDNYTRKYINIIKSNSERMQTLIQQLIDFRKAETGHLRLEIEQVDIAELTKFVIDNFLDILEQKKISYRLSFTPENLIWKTDRDSVEKIIFNLISNAVKYTPTDESIEIEIKTSNNQLIIKVMNTGVGIKANYQQRIFDRFEVLARFEKQVSKGLETRNGIGLALCKNIVEVLQGNIEVESDGETFTTFVVTIPENNLNEREIVKTQELSKIKTQITTYKEVKLTQPNNQVSIPDTKKEGLVLIIDDEKEIRELLTDFLSQKYEISEATNGLEAFEVMKQRMPVIIICDIIMPVMDGVEFVKTMKEQKITKHIPIILLSSKGSIENQIEGLEVGADAYLSKPFHPRHLEAMIDSLLHRDKAVLDYSESHYSAVEQFEGNLIRKEDKELILDITRIIYDNIDKESLSMDFIANEIAISKMQLYRKMKEITKQTPTEYIRSIRLKQSEKLLKTTGKTVQEIMYLCGFNNKAYFYREFTKKYQLTPKEYRNQE